MGKHFMYLLQAKEDRIILDFRKGEEEGKQQNVLEEVIPKEKIIKKACKKVEGTRDRCSRE